MISDKLKNVILKELKLDEFEITADTTADQIPGWDSLTHLNVILAVEQDFNIRFNSYELLRLKNIGELQSLINSKIIK